jgi:peptidoglycan hydrolase CwlO-like protein
MENVEEKVAKLEKTLSSFVEYTKGVNNTIISVLENMNGQLNNVEGEIQLIKTKIENLDGHTNKGFGKMDGKLEELKSEIQKINNVTGYKDMFDNMKGLIGQA